MSYSVQTDFSPAYELVGSFIIFCKKKWIKHLDIGSDWTKRTEAKFDQAFLEAVERIQSTQALDYFYLLTWHAIEKSDTRKYLRWLSALTDEEITGLLRPYLDELPDELCQQVRYFTTLLEQWNTSYYTLLDKDMVLALHHDYQLKSVLTSKMDPPKLVELATSGVILEPSDGLHTVVLVPTVHFRPLNYYMNFKGVMMVHYALDMPEAADTEAPPIHLTRITRALSDPSRLQLLRCIVSEPKSFSEVVQESKLSKGTVHHHMMMLRAAGLVRIHIHGLQERFSFRTEGISELKGFLEYYLA
ncbi:ArsR/SmtB family transcription factor [Paenibacillus gansuensis]|uniref:ArsR/SmtB family transcription factor n=1 Tax=Paenibacillus gansuensis TaxID=306542 RepID=A0ABW5PCB6_9BACL